MDKSHTFAAYRYGVQVPVRVHVSTGYNRVEGNRRASRDGLVSDLPPEIPHVTIRDLLHRCIISRHSPSIPITDSWKVKSEEEEEEDSPLSERRRLPQLSSEVGDTHRGSGGWLCSGGGGTTDSSSSTATDG
jgi:hypothetical protein